MAYFYIWISAFILSIVLDFMDTEKVINFVPKLLATLLVTVFFYNFVKYNPLTVLVLIGTNAYVCRQLSHPLPPV